MIVSQEKATGNWALTPKENLRKDLWNESFIKHWEKIFETKVLSILCYLVNCHNLPSQI